MQKLRDELVWHCESMPVLAEEIAKAGVVAESLFATMRKQNKKGSNGKLGHVIVREDAVNFICSVMRDLQQCRRPVGMQDDENLVFDYCTQLTLNHRVPDALWQQAVTQMGEQTVIDLTVLSGTYVMVSMLLNATQVGIPGGGAEPLQVLDPVEIRQRLLA